MDKCNWKLKFGLFILYAIAYTVCYVIPNFYSFFTPKYLPTLFIDEQLPFLPWTFSIYLSDYILVAFPIILLDEDSGFRPFVRTVFGVLFVSGFFFYFFPTIYDRPVYPEVSNPILSLMLKAVGSADMPTNCFPSMHVATTAVAVWATRAWGRRVFFGFIFWGILICISTMTTKQHYFWDILGGVLAAAFVTYLDRRFFPAENRQTILLTQQ